MERVADLVTYRGAQILELATLMYPDKDDYHWNNLGQDYALLGQYEKAQKAFLRSVARPGRRNSLTLHNLAWNYINLGRFPEAKATLETAISEGKESAEIHRTLYRLGSLEGDAVATTRHATWVDEHPDRDGMSAIRVTEACFLGQFRKSRRLLEDYVLRLEQETQNEVAAEELTRHAWQEAVAGNREMARAFARRGMEKPQAGTRTRIGAACALAASGEVEEANRIARELSREYPGGTLIQGLNLPTVRALEALWQGRPQPAVESLRPTLRFGPQPVAVAGRSQSSPNYVRGLAFLAMKRPEEAAAEFRAILGNPGRSLSWHSIEYPAALVGLARAKAQTGDVAGARQSYERFLELWREADPDIPLLQEAQAEYGALQN